MLFKPFNSYTVHQAFGKDWSVEQLTVSMENGYVPEGFPIDGDATAIARKEYMDWLNSL